VSKSVTVNIFNQSYSLRSNHTDSGEYILQLAQLVDERMQQIAAQLSSHDIAKVAVLAALNLADELSRLKEQQQQPESAETETTEEESQPEPRTWFDSIFDASSPAQEKGERLSSQVAAKLKARRADAEEDEAEPTSL
jgi:cell division protein ZapA